MKGIILAGGSGTRLYPTTLVVSKQLLPVYDKPMIYYPISTLLQAGIREILIITTKKDADLFRDLLGDGSKLGCSFSYEIQEKPRGLADAFIVGEKFIGSDKVAMILGDNIFSGTEIDTKLKDYTDPDGGIVFGYQVTDPERYGVVEFDENMNAISIEEKPENPKSNYAIPGLYFFDNQVSEIAKKVKPSARGEIEITEIHNAYLRERKLKVCLLDRGTAWLDTGTFDSLNDATEFVRVIEKRQGFKIGCIEEVAFRKGYIDIDQFRLLVESNEYSKSQYGQYLREILKDSRRGKER
jgi:glucose-1-phosphate thymidylyltransferase